MCHHAEGVNARVGSTGSVDPSDRGKELSEGFLNPLLHRDAGGLNLPALIVRAVIGDSQLQLDEV